MALPLQNTDMIPGSSLMVFVKEGANYKAIAFANSHQFSTSLNTSDVQTKDHGSYPGKVVNGITWQVTTENIYCTNTSGGTNGPQSSFSLMSLYSTHAPVHIVFTDASNFNTAPGGEQGIVGGASGHQYWTADTTTIIAEGDALITDLQINASAGENATISATFTGTGNLVSTGKIH